MFLYTRSSTLHLYMLPVSTPKRSPGQLVVRDGDGVDTRCSPVSGRSHVYTVVLVEVV